MGLEFFKPNKSVKGALAHFTFNSKDGALFLQIVRQTGYDAQRHIGSFKDGAKINAKFNANEIGGLLRSLRELREVKFLHTSKDSKTNIIFGPYNQKDTEIIAGFGLSLFKGDEAWRVPFTLDEAYLLEEYLKYALTHFFDAIYSDDKQRAAAYTKKKEEQQSSTSPAPVAKGKTSPKPAANAADFGDDAPSDAPQTNADSDDEPPF
jgi:hypothetical protein